MRYALRNQSKIKAHFEPNGQEILDRILKSLDSHFNKYQTIELIDQEPVRLDYPLLFINDEGHSCAMIAFHVLEIKYDIYRLAFKEFIG